MSDGTVDKLNPSLISGGNVGFALLSPDSSRVVYLADQETDEVYELFVSYEEQLSAPPVAPIYLPLIMRE
ncbi:MAG: hypothetical protein U0401_26615 [Anaerolineae bacterium]